MKKFAFLLIACLTASLVHAQTTNPLTKSQQGEEATYEVVSKSKFGENKNMLTIQMFKVGISRLQVRKNMKWKGRDHSRITEFKNNRIQDILSMVRRSLEQNTEPKKGWSNPEIKMSKISTESVSFSNSVKITTVKKTKGSNEVVGKSQSRKDSFNCYKFTVTVNGKYRQKQAKMTTTYWIAKPSGSNRVPVFGWVKVESKLEKTIQKMKMEATVKMTLKKMVKVKF